MLAPLVANQTADKFIDNLFHLTDPDQVLKGMPNFYPLLLLS